MRLVGRTHAASSVPPERPKNGIMGGRALRSPPCFLGIIALATVPADAYEDSRANLS